MNDRQTHVLALHDEGLNGQQIAERIGVTRVAICRYLRLAGIHGKSYEWLKSLTARQQAILLGTLLGDGCLKRFNKRSNAQITLAHCAAQADYLRRDGFRSICAASRSHPILTEYHTLFYGTGKKAISSDVLARLDQARQLGLLLAVWYMDDGSISAHDRRSPESRRSANLALGGLDEAQYAAVRDWFAARSMPGRLKKLHGTNCAVLRFGVGPSEVLFDMVRPYIHPNLRYKLPEGRNQVVREGGCR